MWTVNFQMFKLVLEKAEEPEIKLSTSVGSSKKQESSRKTPDLLTTQNPLTVWITTNCGKFFKRWEYQTTWPTSWETYMQVRKQQLELGIEQCTGSKVWKEYVKAVYCQPAYLTSMQSSLCEMLDEAQAGIKIARRNINNLRYSDDTTLMPESKKNWRASWWKWKRKVKKLA